MDLGQILEFVDGSLLARNAELVLQLPRGSDANTELLHLDLLFGKVIQRMRAAGVGPHVGESDLFRRALLEEKFAIGGPEYKCRECAMEQSLIDVFHQMAYKQNVLAMSGAQAWRVCAQTYRSFYRQHRWHYPVRLLGYTSPPLTSTAQHRIQISQCQRAVAL